MGGWRPVVRDQFLWDRKREGLNKKRRRKTKEINRGDQMRNRSSVCSNKAERPKTQQSPTVGNWERHKDRLQEEEGHIQASCPQRSGTSTGQSGQGPL